MSDHSNRLIWIDLEMTGLIPTTDRIIEIATIVTDNDLNIIEEGPVLAIHQHEVVLSKMDDWNKEHHGNSGLIKRVRRSVVSEAQAETETLEFLRRHVTPETSPMCGNSICQDRRFLARWMPTLEAFFHYRQIDVSSIKECVNRWYPKLAYEDKHSKHLALDDIKDSIEELKYYRSCAFVNE